MLLCTAPREVVELTTPSSSSSSPTGFNRRDASTASYAATLSRSQEVRLIHLRCLRDFGGLTFLLAFKVYDPAMPTQLPPLLFASRLLRQAFKLLLLVLRSCLVGITWLGIVPWLTIWAFRLYFVMGNGL